MKKNLGDKIIWRLNIVDLILIGLVLLSVLALIYKFVWTARNNPETEFVFTYICEKAPTDVLAGINSGDKCADGDYGTELGVLENVEKSGGLLTDGGATKFTSRVAGEKIEHGIKVGDVLYLKGKEFNLIIGDAIFAVYISNITEIFD